MKIKTSELIDAALDWAVAECEGCNRWPNNPLCRPLSYSFRPSVDWGQGGPIIEREGLYLKARNDAKEWKAGALSMNRQDNEPGPLYSGPTPLIAAMRCYVASKLGDVVEIPEELVS